MGRCFNIHSINLIIMIIFNLKKYLIKSKISLYYNNIYIEDVLKLVRTPLNNFTSRLLKLSFSLSMHLYNSDGRHA